MFSVMGLGLFSFLLSGVIISVKEWNDGAGFLLGAVMLEGWFVGFFLDDIRLELQNNADIVDQLNTLAALAVNVSSCVSFNRIQAVQDLDQMEAVAKELFLKNELFASM